jgi:transposase InsO family protein
VTRGGYYAWSSRQESPPGPRDIRRRELMGEIQKVYEQSRGTYGSPRVYQELKAQGQSVCENTVARLMKDHGIRSVVRRRFRVRTTDSSHAHPVAPNRLERNFDQDLPDKAWCADLTYVPTDEGWLYLACVIDLCSRKIVGWSMADHLRAQLCTEALDMALAGRRPSEGLLHHSDRGVQYACNDYRQLLEEHGIQCSMSGKGDCWDNAVMESFFKTLKSELVYQTHYRTREEARRSIFEYVEVFYNRQRRHSSLGYLSPAQFEAQLN